MTEETKQIMDKAADDVAMLSLEEGEAPWARLRREVRSTESKHHNLGIRAEFEETKRLVLELLAGLEERKCPHVPRVINERDQFLCLQWDNRDDRISMGVNLWDYRSGVQVAAKGRVISDYEWSKGDKVEIVLRYLHLVFPLDPPGWDRLRTQAKIHSAHEDCPKSIRDYYEKTKEAVVAMLCELQARGCPWLPEIDSGYYDGIGLRWTNGKKNRWVVYGLRYGGHYVGEVAYSSRLDDGYKAADLVLERLKLLLVSDQK